MNESPQYLFLDRDGVINERLPDDYVKSWAAFRFLANVTAAMAYFSTAFRRVIIVTNQQGIGKGLMTTADLDDIHRQMIAHLTLHGGRVDAVYHCPMLADQPNNCRKPAPQMGWWAKRDFPDLDFSKAIMVGDSESDIFFGKNLGMKTVFIGESATLLADVAYPSLWAFAQDLATRDPQNLQKHDLDKF